MNSAVVCISSNVADKEAKVADAIKAMSRVGEVTAQCVPFEFPALNGRDKDYVNAVVTVATELSLADVTTFTKKLENELGRLPQSKTLGIVPADVDIVIWNGEALRPDEAVKPYFVLGFSRMETL